MGERGLRRRSRGRAELADPRSARAACARGRAPRGRGGDCGADRRGCSISSAFSSSAKADYAEAEPLYRRALAIDEQSYGPDHPNVASDLNNLAQLLQATNRLAEAEPLMRRALAIDEKSYGPDHPNVAIRLNNLAQLLQATNRLAEAEPLIAARSRSTKRATARIIPMWRPTSTISRGCFRPRTASPRPSR